jgi:hypothetical protein
MFGMTSRTPATLDPSAHGSTARREQTLQVLRAGFIAGLCGGIVAALVAAIYSPARLAARDRQARAVAMAR